MKKRYKQQYEEKSEMFLRCCYGISSKASENKSDHIFMIDYDKIELASVINHLMFIQKEFDMSSIYIIESTNGYNALSLDIMGLGLVYSIGMDIYSPADRKFFTFGYARDYYTIRFDEDKKLVRILKSNSMKYEKSLVHKQFLEFYFNIDIEHDNRFNDYTHLDLVQYPSLKHGYHLI